MLDKLVPSTSVRILTVAVALKKFFWALLLAVVVPVFAQDVPSPSREVVYKTVGDVELKLHIFNPPGFSPSDRRAGIVFFFGGGWAVGSAKQFYAQSQYLASMGMVAISADYRIRSLHDTSPRESLADGRSAIRWIRAHARELGIDPTRLAAGGGSAGGQIAAAAGVLAGEAEEKPNALVLFNPAIDTGPGSSAYRLVKDYWKDFSPLHNLGKHAPPTVIFLGTEDQFVPVSTANNYKIAMNRYGVRCELFLYEGQRHGFFNYARDNRYYFSTMETVVQFLSSLGYIPSVRG